jgi:N-acetylglutamate synthase-like GNAT family acetyltransferase
LIRPAKPEDKDWILEIFAQNKVILGGKGYGSLQWKRFWDNQKQNEHWVVLNNVAFCHYLTRLRDGVNVIYEIATHNEQKKQGYGKKIVEYIGMPIELKTDYDSPESNNFYKKVGFSQNGIDFTNSGKKMQKYKLSDELEIFND